MYGDLDQTSGGFRYDRKLVSHLTNAGDEVDIISLPWRRSWKSLANALSPTIRDRIDQPVDVLLQDELCYPSLWQHNHHLQRPTTIISIVHLIDWAATGRIARYGERRYLKSLDAAICTSEATAEQTRRHTNIPIAVAPPSGKVNGQAVDAQSVRQRASESGPIQIVFVGNVIPRKGIHTLLAGLTTVDPEWELTVVGDQTKDAQYANSIRTFIHEQGLDSRITITGELAEAKVAPILHSSHILAMPSRYEGFGMVYLEGMEYGVVPLSTTNGGAGEFIIDGSNGFLIDPSNPAQIGRRITYLAENREQLATMGIRALTTAKAHPSWEETLSVIRSFMVEQLETADDQEAHGRK